MSIPASLPFPRLQDALIEGRLANVFYRRDQLRHLQEGLVRQKDALQAATVQDGSSTVPEALAELYLTLTAVKQYHDGLKPAGPDGLIAAEYRITHGRDAADAQERVGIAVIVPQRHTLVYSVVVPLAAAIAAGNCAVVVLEKTLQSLPPLLSGLLGECIDRDIWELVSSRPAGLDASDCCIQVVQTGDDADKDTSTPRTLLSPVRALVVAIVDRTANLEQAAQQLVDARLRFGGRSPYAPDIVLVNEFAKQDFLRAAVQHWIRYTTDGGPLEKKPENGATAGKTVPSQNGVRTVTAGSDSRIEDVLDRSTLLQAPERNKVCERALRVHAVRSLDDAVELITDMTPTSPLAVYAFGDLPSCKYLLQFTSAHAGFANTIPPELLVGPAAPKDYALSLTARYDPGLFSVPRPKFAETSALSREMAAILDSRPAAVEAKLLRKVELEARAPVRLITGYFEMSALVGLITRVAFVGALTCYGVQKVVSLRN
ncbi:aldehyde dehydrogenase [Grosmannia clavigera kw1407]|uniref:Aldehyde dehydrogenase n=1 Tax=Grosmannia clavigera (strain kw1407 / UAMH 11150) TaxID=655863 RepID=F0XED2_GROCL|nr:aldehyde dehydrogenase [Grosmannia clavigera kw1407]EFX04732.1 aldehyde dehydrogenase [Grosmannia clavigera kw1407]